MQNSPIQKFKNLYTESIGFDPDEFSQGKIVPGDAGRANKELEVRNKGNEIFIKMYNC